ISGATVDRIPLINFPNFEISVPFLSFQKKVTSILSNYDDLIENNTRRLEILEEMAKLIYEEWFVKFRFPGHENARMVPSELGEIPEGWKVRKVSEILKRLKAGNKYTKDNVSEEGLIPVIDQSEKEILGFHNNVADHTASLENPIMIFGDHTCKIRILIEPFSIGPNVVPLVSEIYPEIFVFFLIKNLVQTKEYKRHWNELQAKEVVLPDVALAKDFVNVVNLFFKQSTLLEHKNQNLRKTRDLLIPKLISGKIDVSDLNIRIRNENQEL
ncbi:MAG: type restriction enzyme subunit, partial [Euryarchaeota archaeon]|nr:type restriction enzyme subunit [Euryarchaeota archaeon]